MSNYSCAFSGNHPWKYKEETEQLEAIAVRIELRPKGFRSSIPADPPIEKLGVSASSSVKSENRMPDPSFNPS